MAKKAVVKPAAKKQAPPPARRPEPAPRNNVPATVKGQDVVDPEMRDAMAQDAGKGVSTAASDNIVPLIYILQSLSPPVLRQKQEYIPGALAGMFWMRGTKEVVDGEEGIPVILCHMNHLWIEWRQDRGGFVQRHATKPTDAEWTPDPKNPKKGQWLLENGNYVAETREHAVVRADTGEAYVLPLSGSNHGPARQWMTNCNRKRVPGTDLKAALWGYVWRIKTVAASDGEHDWFKLAVDDAGEPDEEGNPTPLLTWNLENGPALYKLAKQLNADFGAGVKQSDQGEEHVDSDGDEEVEEGESAI